jgi:hypothetical protein
MEYPNRGLSNARALAARCPNAEVPRVDQRDLALRNLEPDGAVLNEP